MILRLTLVFAVLGIFVFSIDAREWTNVDGKKLEAELVSTDSTTVTLKLANGKKPKINIATLSEVDRDFINKWHLENEKKPISDANTPSKAPMGAKEKTASADPVGFDGTWPDDARVPEEINIEIVKEDHKEKVYIYRSTHFEFTCDVQLRPRLVSTCAKIFEATHEFLRVLPLNHRSTGKQEKPFSVTLFEDIDDYHKAGGPTETAGVCITRGDQCYVLVPLESMGVRKVGKDYSVASNAKDNSILPHEITHLIMEKAVKQASWYIEGSAEYVANTPYNAGRFKIAVNRSAIIETVTGYGKGNTGGRALGKKITMMRLQDFMTLPYDVFVADAQKNYGLGCLLTYYFYHQDGKGDGARIKEYLMVLQAGEKEEKARDKLLDGRTWEQLEEEFATGMRKFSVKIDYKVDK